ncbi:MAG TPA: amino acid racemase [Bacteroidota bacterium]|jgi:aspartate racemase|nr:amino acid racemase [Bacteroidota bacterium]
MKEPLTIGIVGGTSPESTISYYRHIIRAHESKFHDHSYPRIVISSVSFQQYIDWQTRSEWDRVAKGLEEEMRALAAAGADFAMLAANTMHKVLPQIKRSIPVLSVLDAVGSYAREKGVRCVGLTGTKYTMSARGFYVEGLEQRGLDVVLPEGPEQDIVHRIIFEELIVGTVLPASVDAFYGIMRDLSGRGADAVLLGCTELDLLTTGRNAPIDLIDSARVHAEAAWDVAMSRDLSHPMLSQVKGS